MILSRISFDLGRALAALRRAGHETQIALERLNAYQFCAPWKADSAGSRW